jgi:hypothetical protein
MSNHDIIDLLEWCFDETDLLKAKRILKVAIKHNYKVEINYKRLQRIYNTIQRQEDASKQLDRYDCFIIKCFDLL